MEKVRRKAVNMEDVAKAAGVSVSTVSHVINRTASISEKTVDRVHRAMMQVGYVPRVSAELNKGQRSIGVFVPEISNEFYARSIQALFQAAWEDNYAVMVCSLEHRYQMETSYIRSLIQSGVKGLIFFGGASENNRQIINASKQVPVVLADRRMDDLSIDSVGIDNVEMMRRMVGRIARAGYSRIGYISEDLIMNNCADRYQGYKLGMAENGLTIDERWVYLLPELRLNKMENAYRYFTGVDWERPMPQILLCSSDLIAVGLMAALRNRGLHVPRDVGVVGFDDISLAAMADPPLTTVAQDMRQLGKTCFTVLRDRIENPKRSAQSVTVQAKIVIRDSVRL